MIKEYGRLEEIIDMKEKLNEIEYEKIRDVFLQPNVVNIENPEFRDPDNNEIIQFLCKERNFSVDRVSSALQKMKKVSNSRSQTLEQWFN